MVYENRKFPFTDTNNLSSFNTCLLRQTWPTTFNTITKIQECNHAQCLKFKTKSKLVLTPSQPHE